MYHISKFKIIYVDVSPKFAYRFFRWKTRCYLQAIHYRRCFSTWKSSTVSNFLHLILSYLFQSCRRLILSYIFGRHHSPSFIRTKDQWRAWAQYVWCLRCRRCVDWLYATPIWTRLFCYSITFVFYHLHDMGSTWVRTYWPCFYDNHPNDHQTL